jgi:hypothetical protein
MMKSIGGKSSYCYTPWPPRLPVRASRTTWRLNREADRSLLEKGNVRRQLVRRWRLSFLPVFGLHQRSAMGRSDASGVRSSFGLVCIRIEKTASKRPPPVGPIRAGSNTRKLDGPYPGKPGGSNARKSCRRLGARASLSAHERERDAAQFARRLLLLQHLGAAARSKKCGARDRG